MYPTTPRGGNSPFSAANRSSESFATSSDEAERSELWTSRNEDNKQHTMNSTRTGMDQVGRGFDRGGGLIVDRGSQHYMSFAGWRSCRSGRSFCHRADIDLSGSAHSRQSSTSRQTSTPTALVWERRQHSAS